MTPDRNAMIATLQLLGWCPVKAQNYAVVMVNPGRRRKGAWNTGCDEIDCMWKLRGDPNIYRAFQLAEVETNFAGGDWDDIDSDTIRLLVEKVTS